MCHARRQATLLHVWLRLPIWPDWRSWLWAPLSSCTVLPPYLTMNPQPDGSLVTAVRVDHDVMWLAVGFNKHSYFRIGFSRWRFTTVPADSWSRAWTQLDVFPVPYLLELCETAHMLDWLLCLAHPWLASCQSTPLFFFDSIVEWILGILHRTDIRFDLLHLMSCFHGWQVQYLQMGMKKKRAKI